MIFPYWVFLLCTQFSDSVCNGCHDMTIISDMATITIKNFDYCCIVRKISKS